MLDTREQKTQVDRSKLLGKWQAEMDEQGFTLAKLEAIQQPQPTQALDALTFDETAIVEQVAAKSAVFRLQDIYRAAAELAQYSGDNARQVEAVT